jgi:hypothetical protein
VGGAFVKELGSSLKCRLGRKPNYPSKETNEGHLRSTPVPAERPQSYRSGRIWSNAASALLKRRATFPSEAAEPRGVPEGSSDHPSLMRALVVLNAACELCSWPPSLALRLRKTRTHGAPEAEPRAGADETPWVPQRAVQDCSLRRVRRAFDVKLGGQAAMSGVRAARHQFLNRGLEGVRGGGCALVVNLRRALLWRRLQ